jgi:hypothetical protein
MLCRRESGAGSLALEMDVAFILTKTAELPSTEAVKAAALRYGLQLNAEPTPSGPPSSYEIAGVGQLTLMPIPAPFPDLARAPKSPTSPTSEELAAASAHFILTVLGFSGPPRQRDAKMAGVAAAVATACNAIGIKLAHGVVFHKAGLYAELTAAALDLADIAPETAIDITTTSEPRGRIGFLTHGLARYDRSELHITASTEGRGALGFVFDMIRWQLSTEVDVLPGHTVGRTAEEKLPLIRAASPAGRGPEVLRIDLPD